MLQHRRVVHTLRHHVFHRRLTFGWAARAATLLAVLVGWLGQPAAPAYAAPAPTVALSAPSSVLIGENFSFTATFSNPSVDVGYGPFIDLIFPVNGADGAAGASAPDGIDFVSAAYLGQPVDTTVIVFPDDDGPGPGTAGTVNHPYAVDNTNTPLTVTGTAGDKLVVLRLPFGSFTSAQPPINVAISAALSNYADLGTPLTLRARGGFMFGATPLNDWCCDPAIVTPSSPDSSAWPGQPVTPSLITVSKAYVGPEDETATGPNFPRQYRVTVDIPTGQTVTNLIVTDTLPNSLQFVSLDSSTPASAPVSTPSTSTPGGALSRLFASVTGTSGSADAEFLFTFYVPLTDAASANILNPNTGDDVVSLNNVSAAGLWTPLDVRDLPALLVSVNGPGPEHTLTDKSIAVQKSVANVMDGGAPGNSPGDTLEYTLDFQISDYFTFGNIVITDTLTDGQRFVAGTATLSVADRSGAVSGAFPVGNLTVDVSQIGNDPNPATDGSTTLVFDVSGALVTLGAADGILQGGRATAPNAGPAAGTIRFRAQIQDQFSDTYPSGDPSVDHGDVLSNTVTAGGTIRNNAAISTVLGFEQDTSGAGLSIAFGVLTKSVYAINGSTAFATPVKISPGDTVTYRLQYTLPSSDYEDLLLVDYLPLPIFDATEITAFTYAVGSVPAAGQAQFGPGDTFHLRPGAGALPFSPLTLDAAANSVAFDYGSYDDPANVNSAIDLLFTLTVSSDPFADGLYLTNQARAAEGTTNAGAQNLDTIVQIQLTEPVLLFDKAVVATDNPNAVFTPAATGPAAFNAPGTSGARWAGVINSTNLAASPINSNVSDIDAGDRVTFALVIENAGTSAKGAFDIVISDAIPAGFQIPPGGLNLRAAYGDNSAVISYTLPFSSTPAAPGDLFTTGIQLADPGTSQGVCQAHHATNGLNIIVITYDLQATYDLTPGQALTNTGTLSNYAGSEGGPDHTPTDLTDTAISTAAFPVLSKTLVGTEIVNAVNGNTQAVIGELITYTVSVTVPEGTTPNAVLTDTLDSGLAFVDQLSASAPVSVTLTGSTAPSALAGGQTVVWNFGTITNTNDNSAPEIITLAYRAVVLDAAGNQSGAALNNSATFRWTGGGSLTASAPNVSVIEPALTLSKTAAPTVGDASDPITFTLTISNTGAATTDAFDVALTDVVPSNMTFVGGSLAHVGGLTPTLDASGAPSLSASWVNFPVGSVSTIQFQAVFNSSVTSGQIITNTALARWTSLSGSPGQRSAFNSGSTERTGADGPGGALDDYAVSASASVSVAIGLNKSIAATSEAHTGNVSGVERLAVGEIIRYHLVITLPESSALNFQIRDNLPAGLTFLNDGTARAAFVFNGAGITSTTLTAALPGCAGLNVIGSSGAVTPACPLPDTAVSSSATLNNDTYNSGTDPFFKLGDLVNNDNDLDPELLVVEFNALADNTAAGSNDAGDNRNNTFNVFVNGAQISGSSNTVNGRISEPSIPFTAAAKTVSPLTGDAGDVVTYTVAFTSANGANNTTAFDVAVTDTLPASAALDPASLAVTSACAVGPASLSAGNAITVTFTSIPVNCPVTIRYAAALQPGVQPAELITNTARLVYTSLPLTGTVGNPTGSSTPGASGAGTGERNGSGGAINDHNGSDTATVAVTSAGLGKTLADTSQAHTSGANVAIGEIVTYTLTLTLPEGLTPSLVITDNLPAGLAYVSGSGSVDGAGFSGALPAPAIASGGGGGDDVTFTFGAISVPNDNDPGNDTFRLQLQARVLDAPGNAGTAPQTQLPNTAVAQAGSDVVTSGVVTATVVEPSMGITKDIVPAQAAANDWITVTLAVQNSGTTTAFDVIVEDALPNAKLTNITGVSTPAGFTFAAVPSGAFTIVRYTGGDLLAGQSAVFTFTAQAAASVTAGEILTNTAVVTQATTLPGPDPSERNETPSTGTDTVTFTAPDLALTKDDGLASVTPGQTVLYTLTVSNLGQRDATGVVITETVPANTTFNAGASTPGWGCANGAPAGTTCTFAVGSLAAGANLSVSFAVNVASSVPAGATSIVNTASAGDDGAHGADSNPADNGDPDADTLNAAPDLQLIKDDGGIAASPGGVIAYTLTYTNAGSLGATGVMITETVPANTTFNAGPSTPGWSCANGAAAGSVCVFNVGALPAGVSGSVVFAVAVDNPLPAGVTGVSNTAVIGDDGANGGDPTPGDNTSTQPTSLAPPTAVDLLYFRADGVNGQQVTLAWATAMEVDNFGFNVYRAPVNDFAQAALIHFEPASPRGSGGGAAYGFVDAAPAAGQWWYWLADVDTHGLETLHGPITVTVGAGSQQTFTLYLPIVIR
jgi:fimbrial isopeptide formation D2 family protein/uncharacterized repeat protein (TIGR01451 family)